MVGNDRPSGLTRDEWNAAYFLGLERIVHGDLRCDFDGQLRAGAKRLATAGYRFDRRASSAETAPPEPTAHERACRELLDGTFDAVGRARDALHWLARYAPGVDSRWLDRVVAGYDRTHGEPASHPPPNCFERAA